MKKQQEQNMAATQEDNLPKQSKGKRIANTVINVVLVIALILAAICTYTSYVSTSGNGVPSLFGVRMLSIQTKSMYPTLKPGDLIFDTGIEDMSELQAGDIISYWTIIDGERVLNTHRITEIYDGGEHLIFATKGDNNSVEDSLTVHESEVIGQYKGKKIGGLGKVFDYLQSSKGFLIIVVIPVAIFFIYHLIQFFRVLFEYQNVKNKLLYEQERGKTEDLIDEEKKRAEEKRKKEREKLENELREKLRKEIMEANGQGAESTAEEAKAKEAAKKAAEAAKEERAAMEAKIRQEMMEEKAKEEERAAMEAEIRAKIKAEMEAEKTAE